MSTITTKRTASTWVVTVIAVVFGLLTIKSGGSVLFIDGESRQQAGHYVSFVVWFNFIAGFAYVAAGIGLWKRQQWAAWLSVLIAVTTLLIFALLALHINSGGAFEQRTVVAMSIRSLIWVVIASFVYKTVLTK